jgi:hypothetical protein
MRDHRGHLGGALLTIAGAALVASNPGSTILVALGILCIFGALWAFGLWGALWAQVRGHPEFRRSPDMGESPTPRRVGYRGHAGSRADLSKAKFSERLDTGIENEGEVDARDAEFGVSDSSVDKSEEQ